MPPISRAQCCKGKKAAVLIGINYTGTEDALQGCENDIEDVRFLLTERFGFDHKDIVMMTEDSDVRLKPTRLNLIRALKELCTKTLGGYEQVVIHYSGHGTNERDQGSDEEDRKDEAWYSLDGELVKDDELRSIIDGFSPFCRVFVLVDACHSGSSLDLPVRYVGDANTVTRESTTAPLCDVLMISGCRDTQTSADAFIPETKAFNGAMTHAFLEWYNKSNTVFDLIQNMNSYMRTNGYEQEPQLSSSRILKGEEHLSEWLR